MYEGQHESKATTAIQFSRVHLLSFYWALSFSRFPVCSISCPTIPPHLATSIKQTKNPHTQCWNRFCLLLFVIKTTKTTGQERLCTSHQNSTTLLLWRKLPPPKGTRAELQDQDLGSPGRLGHSPTLGIFHVCWTNSVFNSKWRIMQMGLKCLLIELVWACSFCQLICTYFMHIFNPTGMVMCHICTKLRMIVPDCPIMIPNVWK